ncbi:MAG: hypothetical protein GY757_34995 [bacterium]|nr:hypothetical protein [bacterium]
MKKTFLVLILATVVTLFFTAALSAKVQVGEEIVETIASQPYGGVGVVYEKTFHSPNAGYIAIHFSSFDLGTGDRVEISNGDGSLFYTYTEKGKLGMGGEVLGAFWATHIPGDTAVVKLHSKGNGGNGFVIDKWVRGYERELIEALTSDFDVPLDGDNGTEAICSSDDKEWAQCYSGDIYDKSKAVCRLLINGSSACTGWLLGSEGHVMTNNHCIDSSSDANNTDYEFMAEGSCSTNCSGWFACPGTVVATSATFIQTDSALDYTLVKLPTNVTGTYGYLQFRDTLPTVGERIYIPQHPGADGKQISVYSDFTGGFSEVYSTDEPGCSGGPGDIGYYADTEGGSSGSPVIGYGDHLVVALHHCANCPNRGVPIPSIISDLGTNIPNDAIGSGTPPGSSVPTAPSGLSGKGRKQRVVLSWTDNANNETGFYIYQGSSSSSLSLIATVGANTTSYNVTGLQRKTTYYFKVCAYNTEGEACSSVISAKTK